MRPGPVTVTWPIMMRRRGPAAVMPGPACSRRPARRPRLRLGGHRSDSASRRVRRPGRSESRFKPEPPRAAVTVTQCPVPGPGAAHRAAGRLWPSWFRLRVRVVGPGPWELAAPGPVAFAELGPSAQTVSLQNLNLTSVTAWRHRPGPVWLTRSRGDPLGCAPTRRGARRRLGRIYSARDRENSGNKSVRLDVRSGSRA